MPLPLRKGNFGTRGNFGEPGGPRHSIGCGQRRERDAVPSGDRIVSDTM